MKLTFDPIKHAANLAKRDLAFERVADLDWDTARMAEDSRKDYGEPRVRVTGLLEGRLHVAIITKRDNSTRVISFRKANSREVKRYEEDSD